MSDENKEKAKYVGEMILIKMKSLEKKIAELEDRLQKCGVKWDFRLDELNGKVEELEQKIVPNLCNNCKIAQDHYERIEKLEQKFDSRFDELVDFYNDKIRELGDEGQAVLGEIEKLEQKFDNMKVEFTSTPDLEPRIEQLEQQFFNNSGDPIIIKDHAEQIPQIKQELSKLREWLGQHRKRIEKAFESIEKNSMQYAFIQRREEENREVLWVIGNEIINLMNDKIAHNNARLHEINAKEKITEALQKLSGEKEIKIESLICPNCGFIFSHPKEFKGEKEKPEEPCNHDFTLAKVCIHCGEYESLTPRYTVVRKEDLQKYYRKFDELREINGVLFGVIYPDFKEDKKKYLEDT